MRFVAGRASVQRITLTASAARAALSPGGPSYECPIRIDFSMLRFWGFVDYDQIGKNESTCMSANDFLGELFRIVSIATAF